MKLIIGLGNPDPRYQSTRHNFGQTVILNAEKSLNLTLEPSPKHLASVAKTNSGFLATTSVYMNESGRAVAKLVNFHKINPSDLYVIHDDLDLGVGEWKLQFDRGPAGHHGIESIVTALGTQAFWRLRLGIGHPRNTATPSLPVENYVLLPFTQEEKVIVNQTIDKIIAEIQKILGH